MKRQLTDLEKEVFKLAKKMIESEPWYRGVCLDRLYEMDDAYINKVGKHKAAQEIADDTQYWETGI